MVIRRFVRRLLHEPDISGEAFVAYFHKLPDTVQVSWERDGRFIVGHVEAGGFTFSTQGRDANNFVEMVNDAVYTVYDIPEDYRRFMKAYIPPKEALKRLGDVTVPRSVVALSKARVA